jgi:hypothetical protein
VLSKSESSSIRSSFRSKGNNNKSGGNDKDGDVLNVRALDVMSAYVNGFWRYPWRRELHIWEIGTEHWFQLKNDDARLEAIRAHMECVDGCFHSDYSPFSYTLQTGKINALPHVEERHVVMNRDD